MPARVVKGGLPTPEQERKAIAALIAFFFLGVIGIGAAMGAIGLVLIKVAKWVFGL